LRAELAKRGYGRLMTVPLHRQSLMFVFALVAVDMIGFGIIMPVLPALIVELTGAGIAEAARAAGWLTFVYALMQFIFGPIIGSLSDRFGRRPVLIASLVAFAVNYTLMALAPTLAFLFVGRIVAGIAGASFSSAYAYVADVSPAAERAQNFGLVGLAFGIGFTIGPALGGMLGEISTRLPFFAAGVLALVNAIYGVVVLRESLPADRRRPFSLRRSNALGALRALGARQPALFWYAGALLLWQTGHHAFPTIWSFFAIERLGWSAFDIGLSLAVVGVTSATVQGGLIRIIIPRIGEARAVFAGATMMLAAFAIYAAADRSWMIYLAILVGAGSGLVYPSLNGIMSQLTAADAQGELQGAVASLSSLAMIAGPPMMAQVFAAFSAPAAPVYWPGAPFGLAGVFCFFCLLLFAVGRRQRTVTVAA
jgi:DHA1 family tetracycline resistance protein-like MFS transporter